MRIEQALSRTGTRGTNLLIVGAGEAGYQSVLAIQRDPKSGYKPIAFVDDDLEKQNLVILGIPVVGKTAQIVDIISKYEIDEVLLAVPSASSIEVSVILERLSEIAIPIKAIPRTNALFKDIVETIDIQDINLDEIMARETIEINDTQISELLRGKRILVTGAGGSIGSEIARQIWQYLPEQLTLIDRDESSLLQIQLSLEGSGNLMSNSLMLADIRDKDRMDQIFNDRRPQVVFHAAALKHLTLLERYPEEGWKTNVLGTLNLLQVARKYDVEAFINISTDKAVDPTCVLGYTKRIAECLTAGYASESVNSNKYVSVRFGNVLGSRGSVLDIFRTQLKNGDPLTVTHEEASRFVMSIPEAVRLVTQAAAVARNGEVLVLDMGTPIKIYDIAKYFASRRIPPLEINIVGLRPGEKLHEDLIGDGENGERPFHDKIIHIVVPSLKESLFLSLWESFLLNNLTVDQAKLIYFMEECCQNHIRRAI
jgi:FlaA1/EpsC-like NDP-sugar epimerase